MCCGLDWFFSNPIGLQVALLQEIARSGRANPDCLLRGLYDTMQMHAGANWAAHSAAANTALRSCLASGWVVRSVTGEYDLTVKGRDQAAEHVSLIPPPTAAILQISDVHFGWDMHVYGKRLYNADETGYSNEVDQNAVLLADQVVAGLTKSWKLPISAVVMCGDWCGIEKDHYHELRHAQAFLEAIADKLGLGGQRRIIVVPGNHDIDWDPQHSGDTSKKFREMITEWLHSKALTPDPAQAVALIGESPSYAGIAMVPLSSCVTESEITRGMGYIGGDAVLAVRNALATINPEWVIGLVHHQPLPVDVEEESLAKARSLMLQATRSWYKRQELPGFSQLADAGRLLSTAINDRYQVLLHGHRHKAFLAEYRAIPSTGGDSRGVMVVGAPSLSAQSDYLPRDARNGFNLILLRDHPRAISVVRFERERDAQKDEEFRRQSESPMIKLT